MTKLLVYNQNLDALFTVGRNVADETTRRTFEELASILLRAVEEVDLAPPLLSEDSSDTGASYAVAQSTWVRAAGHGSYVTCRAASDPIGTLTADATTFNVYLPRSIADKDPNVYAGDILQYVTVGTTRYAVGESYLDERIGSIKYLAHTDVPNGWQLCDGTGSTPNIIDLFIRGNGTPGSTGGSNTHTHTFTGTPGTTGTRALTVSGTNSSTGLTTDASSGTTESNTTGISVPAHPDHHHDIISTCQTDVAGTGPYCMDAPTEHSTGALDGTEGALTLSHTVTDPGHTHSIGSHTHTVASHTHTWSGSISPDPHDHSFTPAGTIGSGSNIPAYITELPIIRIGPSGEIS